MGPARMWFARGHEDSVSFNRRYVMKDGSVRTNPGPLNPDIARVPGPIVGGADFSADSPV